MEKQAFKRKVVESSNIASIGHSFPRRMLEVEFKNGSIYRYSGVNNKTYKALLSADSKGKEFHRLIRGKYPYKKIKDKEEKDMNYEKMIKEACKAIIDNEKIAVTLENGKIYLNKDEYSLRDLTKKENVIEGAKNVGRKASTGAKAVGRYFADNPETWAPLAASGAIAGGLAAYNAIEERRRRKRKQKRAEKTAHEYLDEMVKEVINNN